MNSAPSLHSFHNFTKLRDETGAFRKKLGLEIDQEEIFKEWDEIAKPFINRPSFKHSLEEGKNRVIKWGISK